MTAFRPEAIPLSEAGERPVAPVRLEFFRHDAKEKPTATGAGASDYGVRLSKEGRRYATEMGKAKSPHPETSIAYGSPRQRSGETAIRHMLANEERVTDESSLEDLRVLIAEQVKVGRKEKTDARLNFNYEGTEQLNKEAFEHYLQKKDFLRWLVEESDERVKQLGDRESMSYSHQAGNVAELIRKYVDIQPRWQAIVAQDPQKYAAFNNELQRHFGSHQSVPESFLMKVIEKQEGREGVSRFIDSLPDKNGFGNSEGYAVVIAQPDDITLRYQDRTWQFDRAMLNEIINEREALDRSVDGV